MIHSKSPNNVFKYCKVTSRSTCYYSENQVFGGATNRDMSLTETCFYSRLYGILTQNKKEYFTNICEIGYIVAQKFCLLSFCK